MGFFSQKKNEKMSIHLLEKVKGEEKYLEIDTDVKPFEARKKVIEISNDFDNGKVNEGQGFIEAEGYKDGRKIIVAAYEDNIFKEGNLEY